MHGVRARPVSWQANVSPPLSSAYYGILCMVLAASQMSPFAASQMSPFAASQMSPFAAALSAMVQMLLVIL